MLDTSATSRACALHPGRMSRILITRLKAAKTSPLSEAFAYFGINNYKNMLDKIIEVSISNAK